MEVRSVKTERERERDTHLGLFRISTDGVGGPAPERIEVGTHDASHQQAISSRANIRGMLSELPKDTQVAFEGDQDVIAISCLQEIQRGPMALPSSPLKPHLIKRVSFVFDLLVSGLLDVELHFQTGSIAVPAPHFPARCEAANSPEKIDAENPLQPSSLL